MRRVDKARKIKNIGVGRNRGVGRRGYLAHFFQQGRLRRRYCGRGSGRKKKLSQWIAETLVGSSGPGLAIHTRYETLALHSYR